MPFTIPNFETYIVATTASDGQGKFHPAIKHGLTTRYWPNRKFNQEIEAYTAARDALQDAINAANAIFQEWNVVELGADLELEAY